MSGLPTLVFIPGAWHKPICYAPVIERLEKHGLRCIPVTNPSTSGDPEMGFKDDLDVARAAIAQETTQGRNVVVIAHSYGGMVGNSAIKGFSRPRGALEESGKGYVIGLVLIASGFTFTGLAFMDPFLGICPPAWRANKETGFADVVLPPRQFFYHDVPEDEANFYVSELRTQTLKSLFEGGEWSYAGWRDVPAWYVGTIEDQGLPVLVQRMNVGMARSMGTTVEHRELQTSHSPFLSQPDEVAEILLDAVGDFAGNPVPTTQDVERKRISTPAARLLQPSSWFRYGLPLLFGRFIGWGASLFLWARGIR